VDGMDLHVKRGELVGLIGPNGAGKTTFFNCLSGWYRPEAGEVWFGGRRVDRLPAYRTARRGLVRTFQITRTLARMTVRENLLVAAKRQPGEQLWAPFVPVLGRGRMARREAEVREKVDGLLRFFTLDHLADDYAGTLSGGQRKLLELARALMVEPQMLLLDEPMAGVNPTLAKRLMERIHEVRKEFGITVLLIEHDMETVMKNCGRIVVMAAGRRLAEGTPEEIQRNPAVIDAYLGGGG
jgi:neutral amino acid transport system ATP-binding protein